MKNTIGGVVSIFGSTLASLFGGWDTGLKVLLILMVIDMITGITSALMNKSTKTESGALNSYVTWKGIIKKIVTLLIICLAYQLDLALGTSVIRDATVIFFVFNEGTSILENAGHIGIPLPSIIQKALDVLKEKSDNSEI